MNAKLREAIGRAAYEAALGEDMDVPWDKLTDDAKEVNMRSAEAAVQAFLEHVKQDFLDVPKRREMSGTQWRNEYYGNWIDDRKEE